MFMGNEQIQEKKKLRVTAITVTYNRTSTLKKCLDALLAQSRCLDDIIVVDNNSNATEQTILQDLVKDKTQVHLLCLPENTGGAGGFEAGMRLAVEKYAADWYWIMDDDAYPRSDCLEKLLQSSETLENVGFVAPLIYGVDLQEHQLYHHKVLKGLIYENIPVVSKVEDFPEICEVEANAFVGPLISKNAVDKLGIADGSLFIYGDDTEYTYRVTRSMKGYVVKSAVIDHQDPPLADNYLNPRAWWKEYYSNRNRFFMIRKFQKPLWRRYMAYVALILPLVKLMAAALIKPKYKGFHLLRTKLLMRSIMDGLCNHRGKTIDPGMYGKMIREREKNS